VAKVTGGLAVWAELAVAVKPRRRACQAVALHAKKTTLTELIGIKMAQIMGCNSPAAAMLTPIRL
jgi:hypothetical protein